jgi:PAT family beta-lactamase induction signal transducer AmpG
MHAPDPEPPGSAPAPRAPRPGRRWPPALAALLASLAPYGERAPLGALLLGLSSGFPIAMIAATLSTRLAEAGMARPAVTAFGVFILVYNFKFLWAPLIDRFSPPVLGRLVGQRRAWLLVIAPLVAASVVWLGTVDPVAELDRLVIAVFAVAFFGATFDIVIDAYRTESLEPRQFGPGAGMSQYGWRLGNAGAAALALVVAERAGWPMAYAAATFFALPALLAALLLGEPTRRLEALAAEGAPRGGLGATFVAPLADFLARPNAGLVLAFILLHKLGDTMANLTLRLLFNDLGFSKDEVAAFDVGFGLVATLAGVLVGGLVYTRIGMMKTMWISLILMAITNLGFAALALVGHSNWAMAAAIGFENFASGIGGVAIVAYLSFLCNVRFTATQFALLSAMASIMGRAVSALGAGALIDLMGYPAYYALTTVLAVPGILIFRALMRRDRELLAAAEQADRAAREASAAGPGQVQTGLSYSAAKPPPA